MTILELLTTNNYDSMGSSKMKEFIYPALHWLTKLITIQSLLILSICQQNSVYIIIYNSKHQKGDIFDPCHIISAKYWLYIFGEKSKFQLIV